MHDVDLTTVRSLQGVAALACRGQHDAFGAELPAPWRLSEAFSSPGGPGGQGLVGVASKEVGRASHKQMVLALGIGWPELLRSYALGWRLQQAPLPEVLLRGEHGEPASDDEGQVSPVPPLAFDRHALQLYMALREPMRGALLRARASIEGLETTVDLLVTGHGLGGALAQLAAYDLRVGKPGQALRFASVACYAFSAPALANGSFAAEVDQETDERWRLHAAASSTSAVDLFAGQPDSTSDRVPPGRSRRIYAKIPPTDDPWWTRSATFYARQLADDSDSRTPVDRGRRAVLELLDPHRTAAKTSLNREAPGFVSSELAWTLARLSAVASALVSHPDLGPRGMPPGYSLVAAYPEQRPWLALFRGAWPRQLVIAFRPALNFVETVTHLAQPGPAPASWLEPRIPGGASLHAGALAVYDGQLRGWLRSNLERIARESSATKILLCGHSLGALLASVAAVDLSVNGGASQLPWNLFAFGCPAVAGYDLARHPSYGELSGRSFVFNRDRDQLADFSFDGRLTTMGTVISLTGRTPFDDETAHALTGYLALLDPRG